MLFTPEKLAEIAAADAEIDNDFCLTQQEIEQSRDRDRFAILESLPIEKRKAATYQKAYREANREKISAYQKAYREANREKISAHKKAYREANREKISAYHRDYYHRKKGGRQEAPLCQN